MAQDSTRLTRSMHYRQQAAAFARKAEAARTRGERQRFRKMQATALALAAQFERQQALARREDNGAVVDRQETPS
jgi:hypothetical protein